MKARRHTIANLVAVVLMGILLTINISAMNSLHNKFTKASGSDIPGIVIKNLEMGLRSNVEGLKRSCVQIAGYYEIEELVKPMIEVLDNEENSDTRMLIALTLYKIGTTEAINAVKQLAKNDADPLVRKVGNIILNKFEVTSVNAEYPNVTKN